MANLIQVISFRQLIIYCFFSWYKQISRLRKIADYFLLSSFLESQCQSQSMYRRYCFLTVRFQDYTNKIHACLPIYMYLGSNCQQILPDVFNILKATYFVFAALKVTYKWLNLCLVNLIVFKYL